MITVILIAALISLICSSALFSGSETGLYRVSRLKNRLSAEEGNRLHLLLQSMLEDSQGLIFSILIGNNISTALATSIATVLVAKLSGTDNSEYYATIIMTPTLLIFGEILPKSIYYYKCDSYMPKSSPLLWFSKRLFTLTGLIGVMRLMSRFFERITHTPETEKENLISTARRHIEGILQDTKSEGYLSYVQNDIANRVLNISQIKITSVMTKMNNVATVNLDSSKDELFDVFKKYPYTRFLVCDKTRNDIVGYVNVFNALTDNGEFSIDKHLEPIYRFTPETVVIKALNKMHDDKLRIALIAKPQRKSNYIPLGIVTIKDLAQEIIGEISVC